jgi:hypothetical protein
MCQDSNPNKDLKHKYHNSCFFVLLQAPHNTIAMMMDLLLFLLHKDSKDHTLLSSVLQTSPRHNKLALFLILHSIVLTKDSHCKLVV